MKDDNDDGKLDQKPTKRRKVPEAISVKPRPSIKKTGLTNDVPSKKDNDLRGLIGRKRKMRKLKGKA